MANAFNVVHDLLKAEPYALPEEIRSAGIKAWQEKHTNKNAQVKVISIAEWVFGWHKNQQAKPTIKPVPLVPELLPSAPIAEPDFRHLPTLLPKVELPTVQPSPLYRESHPLTMAQETEKRETEAFKASIGERIARAKANRNAFYAGRPNISPLTTGADYR